MTLTIEAVYENGVLKPAQPLPLKEQERVQLTVHTTMIRGVRSPVPGLQYLYACAKNATWPDLFALSSLCDLPRDVARQRQADCLPRRRRLPEAFRRPGGV